MIRTMIALFLTSLLLTGMPSRAATPAPEDMASERAEARDPVTILISIDGFRPDYLDRGITPNLRALAATGIYGPMRPGAMT